MILDRPARNVLLLALWQALAVNLGVVAPLLVTATATLWLKRRRATAAA